MRPTRNAYIGQLSPVSMSRFEYFLAFETILYGLVLAHAIVAFSQMLYHRTTIRFYWAHMLAGISIFFITVFTYYSLYWVPHETVTGAWSFFYLRVLPLSLLYLITYQVFPEKMKGMDLQVFFYSRLKEILIPMVIFNFNAATKSIYYRWDEYLELGNGNVLNSSKFFAHVTPMLVTATIALLLIFYFHRKRLIEAFVIFVFIYAMGLMTFGVTSR